MYLQKVICRNTFFTQFFVSVLKVNDENTRIRIRIWIRIHQSDAWIRGSGSGSTPKQHGSATLVSSVIEHTEHTMQLKWYGRPSKIARFQLSLLDHRPPKMLMTLTGFLIGWTFSQGGQILWHRMHDEVQDVS